MSRDDYNATHFRNFSVREIQDTSVISVINRSDVAIFYDENVDICKIIKNRFGSTDQLDIESISDISLITKLKMFWFSRWLAMNYEGYLNDVVGGWYIQQIKKFNDEVFPNMLQTSIENGNFESTIEFIKTIYEE